MGRERRNLGRLGAMALCLNACATGGEGASDQVSSPKLNTAEAQTLVNSLVFEAPGEWVAEPPSSPMRRAQYRLQRVMGDAEDAEVTIFHFPGQGGSIQANLDRWISQFSQPDGSPISDVKVSELDNTNIPLTVLDISGTYRGSMGPMGTTTNPKTNFRMLAAVAATSRGHWFFKLTGPERTIQEWAASFHSFLDTIRPSLD